MQVSLINWFSIVVASVVDAIVAVLEDIQTVIDIVKIVTTQKSQTLYL